MENNKSISLDKEYYDNLFDQRDGTKVETARLVNNYLQVSGELTAATIRLGGYLNSLETALGKERFAEWVANVLPERKARYFIENYKALTNGKNWDVSWRLTEAESGKELVSIAAEEIKAAEKKHD